MFSCREIIELYVAEERGSGHEKRGLRRPGWGDVFPCHPRAGAPYPYHTSLRMMRASLFFSVPDCQAGYQQGRGYDACTRLRAVHMSVSEAQDYWAMRGGLAFFARVLRTIALRCLACSDVGRPTLTGLGRCLHQAPPVGFA